MTRPFQSFGVYFRQRAKVCGEKTLMEFTGDGRRVSYAEIDVQSDRLAASLLKMDVKKGDVVSVLMPNAAEWPILFVGILKCGAIANFINYKFEQEELTYVLKNSESKILFVSDCFTGKIERIRQDLPNVTTIVRIKNTNPAFPPDLSDPFAFVDFQTVCVDSGQFLPNQDVQRDDAALLVYTSGSTGKMKGVVLTHGNILAQIELLSDMIPFSSDDRYLCMQPLFYLDYAFYFWLVMEKGGTGIVQEKFKPADFWKTVAQYRPTHMNATPTLLNILLLSEEVPDVKRTSCLKYISCCGEILQPDTIDRWESRFPGTIYDTYTISEISCCGTVTPFGKRKKGGVGVAHASNEICIMDDEGNRTERGEVGEVCVKGPCVMKEYWKNPELTAKTIIDGWYHSNDLGYEDAEGYFYIVGRKNNIINKGGEKASPMEIENVLRKMDGVEDCAVFGVPDATMGFEIMCVLQTKRVIRVEEVKLFCSDKLAKFKIPKYVEVVSELPRLNTGKIDRQQLIKTFSHAV